MFFDLNVRGGRVLVANVTMAGFAHRRKPDFFWTINGLSPKMGFEKDVSKKCNSRCASVT
jgi:hypothetical protein